MKSYLRQRLFFRRFLKSILRPVRFCEIWALRDKAKGLRMRSTILDREGLRKHEKVQSDFRSAEQVSDSELARRAKRSHLAKSQPVQIHTN